MKNITIENCKLGYLCRYRWDDFPQTTREDQERFCSDCKKYVHYCRTDDELAAAANAGHCVAFERGEVQLVGDAIVPFEFEYEGPGGPYMNEDQRAYFKSVIIEQIDYFRSRIREPDTKKGTIKRLEVWLGELDKALELVETKEYGFCSECSAPIGFLRLYRQPFSRTCTNCPMPETR